MFGKQRPTFLLLPSGVAPDHAYLGRFVTNVYAPGHDYAPQDPVIPDTRGYESMPPVVQKRARGIFRDEKYSSIRGQLSDLLRIDFSKEGANDLYWHTGVITTRTLLNHLPYLQEMLKDKQIGPQLQQFLQRAWQPEDKSQRKDVFLIVGVKEWTEAQIQWTANRSRGLEAGAKIPAGEAVQLPTTKLDIEGNIENRKRSAEEFAASYEGVTAFAVQYRRLKRSKAGGISLEEAQKLGPSVFGPRYSNSIPEAGAQHVIDNDGWEIGLDDDIDEDVLENNDEDTKFVRIAIGDEDLLCLVKGAKGLYNAP